MSGAAQRRAYLQAMGIQAWVRRDGDSPLVAGEAKQDAAPPVAGGEVLEAGEAVVASIAKPQATASHETAAPEAHVDERPLPVEPPVPDVRSELPASPGEEMPVAPAAIPPGVDVNALGWDALQAVVARCTACDLHATRTQTVFGTGNRTADWMIVGEAPGADEDQQGEPFVGRAGQLLNNMLRAIGLQREQVYIANVIKCRPPNNRNPHVDEISQCLGYLQRQIALVKPRLILVVGRVAAHGLLKVDTPLGKLRGQVYRFCDTPAVVTYHPAYLLRTPRDKAKSWDDLRFAHRVAEGHDGEDGQA
ncbi:MAG TPA: uracil-DNA glycosylase [Chromatiales bacterium]|nr:uracil-DNA glycosylase [Chromatiales bacterium]HEX22068.1 uracil-DNA glycosylase [Chromatiales bacterium]